MGFLPLAPAVHLVSTTPGIAAAAGANAGSGPPVPVLAAGSSDRAGNGTFGTGTGPAAGAQVAVTFGITYGANGPGVVVQAANAAAAALGLYVASITGTGFTIACTVAP